MRLDASDERIARELRGRGVSVSDVVRRALRAEAARTAPARTDASVLIAEMLARFPAPSVSGTAPALRGGASLARRTKRPDATDRRAVRELIATRLRSAR